MPSAGPFNPGQDGGRGNVQDIAPPQAEPVSLALINIRSGGWDAIDFSYSAGGEAWPATGSPGPMAINVGDSLRITIYEEKAGGLFIPQEAGVRPGNFVNLPDQIVDTSGGVIVPYVGKVEVVGKSPLQVANFITEQLRSRAINPQVVVTYGERDGSKISVLGDVNGAQQHALNFDGERILDAIARAGGPRFQPYETYVTLQRAGVKSTRLLDDLIQEPDKNVFLQPNDTLYLYRQPSTFSVFGAVGRSGEYPFERRRVSLAQALGKASGLDSFRANAGEVYVYRVLPKAWMSSLLTAAGVQRDVLYDFPQQVPTLFRFNLRETEGFHLTQNFEIQDQDVIYVADADTVNLQKLLAVILPSSASAVNVKILE